MTDQTDNMFLQFLKEAAKYYKGQVSNCFSSQNMSYQICNFLK